MRIPFSKPWITKNDINSVNKALKNRWLSNGPNLKKFEETMSKFLNVKYSMGVSSGTSGLHLALKVLNLKPGDEVIVPTLTFVATVNAVLYCDAKPVLADVCNDTFNIDPLEIKKRISKRTRAIIVVHYGGQTCQMDKISKFCKKKNIFLIEDCAHALGSKFKNKFCGSIGNIGIFSFYPTKIITTGEGGMVTTNDPHIAEKIRKLRSHCLSITAEKREKLTEWKYDVTGLGYNYRMSELNAALGLSQLRRIKIILSKRKKIAKKYDKYLLKISGIKIPKINIDCDHVFHLYTIIIDSHYPLTRDQLFEKFVKKGIGSSIQYIPIHKFKYLKNFVSFKNKDFPIANNLNKKIISLPIFPQMKDVEIRKVVNIIKKYA